MWCYRSQNSKSQIAELITTRTKEAALILNRHLFCVRILFVLAAWFEKQSSSKQKAHGATAQAISFEYFLHTVKQITSRKSRRQGDYVWEPHVVSDTPLVLEFLDLDLSDLNIFCFLSICVCCRWLPFRDLYKVNRYRSFLLTRFVLNAVAGYLGRKTNNIGG